MRHPPARVSVFVFSGAFRFGNWIGGPRAARMEKDIAAKPSDRQAIQINPVTAASSVALHFSLTDFQIAEASARLALEDKSGVGWRRFRHGRPRCELKVRGVIGGCWRGVVLMNV